MFEDLDLKIDDTVTAQSELTVTLAGPVCGRINSGTNGHLCC